MPWPDDELDDPMDYDEDEDDEEDFEEELDDLENPEAEEEIGEPIVLVPMSRIDFLEMIEPVHRYGPPTIHEEDLEWPLSDDDLYGD